MKKLGLAALAVLSLTACKSEAQREAERRADIFARLEAQSRQMAFAEEAAYDALPLNDLVGKCYQSGKVAVVWFEAGDMGKFRQWANVREGMCEAAGYDQTPTLG